MHTLAHSSCKVRINHSSVHIWIGQVLFYSVSFIVSLLNRCCHACTSLHPHLIPHFVTVHNILCSICYESRSQWPSGLRRRSASACLLRLWVRIPLGHGCLSVVSVVCLSGRGLCDELITRPEESYRQWCVVVCDRENLVKMRRPWPALGSNPPKKKNYESPT